MEPDGTDMAFERITAKAQTRCQPGVSGFGISFLFFFDNFTFFFRDNFLPWIAWC
jgi:hypothetical protein